ncbi:MAG: hypothetical protein IPK79_04390 [Vampirovibrionales bacterium]|nr:hypothetical protein [Vampirovibrionales bacterium]
MAIQGMARVSGLGGAEKIVKDTAANLMQNDVWSVYAIQAMRQDHATQAATAFAASGAMA